jgi:hypothetical protein
LHHASLQVQDKWQETAVLLLLLLLTRLFLAADTMQTALLSVTIVTHHSAGT